MDYLYFLQGLREACPSAINMIFVLISEFVVSVGVLIPAIIYWCYDKRAGRRMLFGIGAAKSLADTLKMFLCINRPWILDSRLHLASEVEGTATGYSTMNVTSSNKSFEMLVFAPNFSASLFVISRIFFCLSS